jgi:hypothetical protein
LGRKISKSKQDKKGILYVIPVSLVLLVVPMIVRMAIVNVTPDSQQSYEWCWNITYDFFSYYKSNTFVFLVVFATALLIYYKWRNAINYNRTILHIYLY